MSEKYKFNNQMHCYPGTDVLINKLGITNNRELFDVERELVSYRLAELNENPIKGSFDLKHLQKIHYYLFQDIYAWAGKIRNYDISKNGTRFCHSDYIIPCANDIFNTLKSEQYFINYDYDTKLLKLVQLFADINLIHPFREGNGRTQRLYIESLAKIMGISLDLTYVARYEMTIASCEGIIGKYNHLLEIFNNHSHTISKNVQLAHIQKLLGNKEKKLITSLLENASQKTLKK